MKRSSLLRHLRKHGCYLKREGVDNSSQYVGQLVTEEYGAEIEKLRDRYYRFHDSLFASICTSAT